MKRHGSKSYRFILALLRLIVRAFFRRIVVTGADNVPREGGGVVVSWHPNGLVDPGLVLTQFPRPIVFGARHGIFKWPLLGTLMRSIGTVPIYRAADLPNLAPAERAARNQQSLEALARAVAEGSFSALFPEGLSHDQPHLAPLKTGAARLYYQARSLQSEGETPAVLLPIGLHYDDKDLFRSSAYVEIFPPMDLGDLAWRPGIEDEERVRGLTAEIERTLHDVVLATESWDLYRLMHRARKLVRAERAHRAGADPGRVAIEERVAGFARIRAGYLALLETHPEEVHELIRRVDEYDADLRALGLDDHELDRAPRLASPWLAALLLLQVAMVFLLLPPLLVVGLFVNAPAALVLLAISRAVSRHKKDEATVKLLVGALLFPLSWIAAGIVAAQSHMHLQAAYPALPDVPALSGMALGLLAALGGAAAVRYLRVARETARAVRVRLTRALQRRAIAHLRSERAELCDAVLALGEGLELPGAVLADGRVVASVD